MVGTIQGYNPLSSPILSPLFHTQNLHKHTHNKMKIQCDMCEKTEAAVYCTADEASLCHGCDRRVHHANKLANKHHRFSLHPSSDQPPLCDICQEKRAFLFCKEDRAILCKSCDVTIHGVNEHTQHHNRFLLAGVKLSESSSCYDSSLDQSRCSSNSNGSSNNRKNSNHSINQNLRKSCNERVSQNDSVSVEASSISEYLTETLPGWHVEEFMNPPVSHPYGLYEGDDTLLPFTAHESGSNGDFGSLWSQDLGNLVNSSSGMDDQVTRTSSLSQGFLYNEMGNFENLYKDQYAFSRPRQLW